MKAQKGIGNLSCRLFLFCFTVLLWSISGGTAGSEKCQGCHTGISTSASAHGALSCKDCHVGLDSTPHPKRSQHAHSQNAGCDRCHNDVTAVFGSSVHGEIVTCQGCHGSAHRISSKEKPGAEVSPQRQIKTCGRCHGFTPELIEGYLKGAHAKALFQSGLIYAPTCSDCHGSHDIFTESHPDSRVNRLNSPRTCSGCHVYLVDSWKKHSVHGRLWQLGEDGPVCTTCHRSHDMSSTSMESARLMYPQTCGDCHHGRYSSYRDSFHGQATNLGFQAAAICSDCHTPHSNLPVSDPNSSVHPSQLGDTCGQCHGAMPSRFLSFSIHFDPSDANQNFMVYLIWLFMSALLILVFGAFGIHDLLWLQRSIIGVIRGEFRKWHKADEPQPYIKRFSQVDIKLHMIVILSFLVLAVTGLVLKFHYTAWARVLADALGGLEFSRALHRTGALVTFAYTLFHVLYLCKRLFIDHESNILWGWRSLVPRAKDWRDLICHVRYFLYQGPRPEFDRWSYWEKFDYLAVFWGVVLIGASGLILWLPGFFTVFFPGWVLNAAQLVHSDEALLAVGFVLIFHFFHSHLRPENFPLDTSIFTGSVPLERFRMERPVEYSRLVKAGSLERLYVAPPTRRRLILAYLFALTSMAIGMFLVLGIIWGFLGY